MLRRKKDFVVDTEESAVASGAVPGHEAGGKSIFFDDSLFSPDPWYASLFPDFRSLRDDELRETAGWGIGDVDGGCVFTSVCINTPVYLAWLVGQCLRQGVVFRRATLAHVLDAAASSAGGTAPVDIIVNCTGLLASKLGGVADAAVIPARGQTVLVRNVAPYMVCVSGVDYDGDNTDDSNAEAKGEVVYVMTRAAGGGTILGGTYQKGNWNGEPDMRTARRIMRRAIAACPGLVREGEGVEGLDVIRHAVGLRPYREGGVRIEKEWIADDRNQENFTGCKGAWVVHNYGHAGWGYQSSYGCAERVVELVKEAVALGPMADGSGV